MANADVMVQILHEASGVSKELLSDLLATVPSRGRLDEELEPDAAKTLLSQLRQELPGILNWMIEGALSLTPKDKAAIEARIKQAR